MKVLLQSDFEVTDAGCREATGKTFAEWFEEIEKFGPSQGRREVTQHLYNLMGRGNFIWWATTVWVEYERMKEIRNKKDGLFEGYTICSTKTISASPQEIYDAFTQEGKQAWLGCGPASEGGEYLDESENRGTWLRLRPAKDVRLKWTTSGVPNPTTVDATFVDNGKGKVLVTLTHARIQTREEADGLRRAWGEVFETLKTVLESS